MTAELFKGLLSSLLLCLAQALVFNRIHILGVATPLLAPYFVVGFRRGMPRWALIVWAFAMGLLIDAFANTPGVTAATMSLAALLQPMLLRLFVSQDAPENLRPGFSTLGVAKYCNFMGLLLLIYVVVFFSLELFTYFHWLYWLECVGGSFVFTFVLILIVESLRKRA